MAPHSSTSRSHLNPEARGEVSAERYAGSGNSDDQATSGRAAYDREGRTGSETLCLEASPERGFTRCTSEVQWGRQRRSGEGNGIGHALSLNLLFIFATPGYPN